MAAVLSAEMDNTDKVVNLLDDCRQLGLAVVPPDINASTYAFTVRDDKTILYGLGAIKGVGQGAIEALIGKRGQAGFDSLKTLCRHADAQKLNRRMLEALIRAGSLDSIGPNRATLMAQTPHAMRFAAQQTRDLSSGQVDLFGAAPIATETRDNSIELPEWDDDQRLTGEKETLGLYLTGHPISRYEAELAKITKGCIGEVAACGKLDVNASFGRHEQQSTVLAGLVVNIRMQNTQGGRRAFLTLDDRSGRIEVAVFSECYRRHAAQLNKDKILVVEGVLGFDEYLGQMRLRATKLMDIDEARACYARRITIEVRRGAASGVVKQLRDCLIPFREGPCEVQVDYFNGKAAARLKLGDPWRVSPSEALLQQLRALDGIESVGIVYA